MTRVTFEGRRYPLTEGESVLDALVRGGAHIPFSCRKGTCHACLLRASEGDPGAAAARGVRPELVERGYFLPCQCRPAGDLEVARPNPAELFVRARVHDTVGLGRDVVRLRLEPETNLPFRAGQFVNVRHPSGAVRSYSIASIAEEDYFLELHVKRVPGGIVSPWLADELRPDDTIELQGPLGKGVYERGAPDRSLLLLASGTGLSPVLGIARDALRGGHRGDIFLYHGARHAEGLYLHADIQALARQHPNLRYLGCVADPPLREGAALGRVVDLAFDRHDDLSLFEVHLCGSPAMVHEARVRAFRAGAPRDRILADPFEHAQPAPPEDARKLAALGPDIALWRALGEGEGLRAILTDFYDRVYEDPRLAPFFHRVTKRRAIEKQYEFLRDVFTGTRLFFGLKPFNAHHWMVISDELFDHREAMMDECMRRHGLDEPSIRRWGAIHELFRREIVKGVARGLLVDGEERQLDGYTEEVLSIGALCDGCGAEMPPGATGRMHVRTGELFCAGCGARKIGATLSPPPAGADPA